MMRFSNDCCITFVCTLKLVSISLGFSVLKAIAMFVMSLKMFVTLSVIMDKISFLNSITLHLSAYHFLPLEIRHYIACQFALESDFGSSYLAEHSNNVCGMKLPKKRITTAFVNSSDFAEYSSIASCVEDYVIWLLYSRVSRIALSSVSAFESWLRVSGYCSEHLYVERIHNIYKQYYYE